MLQLCFIINNSLTMDQKPNNSISLLDIVKSSIQSLVKNLYRLTNTNTSIHLFITSNPKQYLSSYQHDQSHLLYQLKSIKTSIDTNPRLAIQTAIDQVSKFRILSQSQTLKGYRQAYVYEPAIIFLFSDRMTKKNIKNIINSIDNDSIQMRSQYQFVSYLIGTPSFTQRNLLTQQKFRSQLQNHQEFNHYLIALRKINGQLKLVLNYQNLHSSLSQKITNYKPSLQFYFQNKIIKRKINQLISSEKGNIMMKTNPSILNSFNLSLLPIKLWKIPLPFQSKCNEEEGQWRIQNIGKFKFYVDFSKRFNDNVSTLIPQNKYKVIQNQFTSFFQSFNNDQKYPIYFEYKNIQCLVGLICQSTKGIQCNFYFPNFNALSVIIKVLQSKQNIKIIQNLINPYLSTIPSFYYKYLKLFFDNFNLNIDIQTNDKSNYPYMTLQNKLESIRLLQKKNLPLLYQTNLQNHQNYKSQCCLIYSQNYNLYSQKISKQQVSYNPIQNHFNQLLNDLMKFKKKIGIDDYLSSGNIESIPVVRQLEKYNNVKRTGQQQLFNENISVNFGSPYRKKRKNNDTQSIKKDQQSQQFIPKPISQPIKRQNSSQVHIISEQKSIIQNKNVQTTNLNRQQDKTKQVMSQTSEQSMKIKNQKNNKTRQIKKIVFTDETMIRINNFNISKQIEVNFNGSNIATNLMLQNENILASFYQKKKK